MDSGGFFHVRFDEHRFPASGATQQKIAQTPERILVEEYRILSGSARLMRAATYQECAQPDRASLSTTAERCSCPVVPANVSLTGT